LTEEELMHLYQLYALDFKMFKYVWIFSSIF
jgi:hypothetical protein